MTDEKKECVGSLLVPSSDVQELSEVTTAASSSSKTTECVGSMLVDSQDLKELSEAPAPHLPSGLLQKRDTAVGTLLIHKEDLETHNDSSQNKTQQGDGHDHRPEMIG